MTRGPDAMKISQELFVQHVPPFLFAVSFAGFKLTSRPVLIHVLPVLSVLSRVILECNITTATDYVAYYFSKQLVALGRNLNQLIEDLQKLSTNINLGILSMPGKVNQMSFQ